MMITVFYSLFQGTVSVVNSSNMISKLPNVEDEQNQSEVANVKPAEPLAEELDESSQVLILVL